MAALNLPASQLAQLDAPCAAVNIPAAQLEQSVPDWYCPDGHTVQAVALPPDNLPLGQDAQKMAPGVEEKVPATQLVQELAPS